MNIIGWATKFLKNKVDGQANWDSNRFSPEDRVAMVSHGYPDARRVPQSGLHGVLLVQSSSSFSRPFDPDQMGILTRHARVFALTCAWNDLSEDHVAKILDFLWSDAIQPDDPDVQRLLGFDGPVRRLALRVALEIVRGELNTPTTSLDVPALLKPVLEIAKGDQQLQKIVSGLEGGEGADRGPEQITVLVEEAIEKLRTLTARISNG